jgi:hypothetical protein
MTERNIVYQVGDWWVCDSDQRYTVYRDGLTHAKADSSYLRTADGLTLAIARTDYLARKD